MNAQALEYKIKAVYDKIFGIKKFRNYIRDGKRDEIIDYLKFQGEYGLSVGWSERNSTIIEISAKELTFNYVDTYTIEDVTDLLINKYSN